MTVTKALKIIKDRTGQTPKQHIRKELYDPSYDYHLVYKGYSIFLSHINNKVSNVITLVHIESLDKLIENPMIETNKYGEMWFEMMERKMNHQDIILALDWIDEQTKE